MWVNAPLCAIASFYLLARAAAACGERLSVTLRALWRNRWTSLFLLAARPQKHPRDAHAIICLTFLYPAIVLLNLKILVKYFTNFSQIKGTDHLRIWLFAWEIGLHGTLWHEKLKKSHDAPVMFAGDMYACSAAQYTMQGPLGWRTLIKNVVTASCFYQ